MLPAEWLKRSACVCRWGLAWLPAWSLAAEPCLRPVYLTLDTGHMGVASHIAAVLQRQKVRVTFFAAHETTQVGDGTLGEYWASWWKARGTEGHAFASHTWQHAYWRGDRGTALHPEFVIQPSAGPQAGEVLRWSAADYCADLDRSTQRLRVLTGQEPMRLFRAPGGKTSVRLLAAAQACGYTHVGWSPAGFLGDELASERVSNQALLQKALRDVQVGDILMAHLGIWSRKDPWAPAVLEPLIEGLKQRGLCFQTLKEHPKYGYLR